MDKVTSPNGQTCTFLGVREGEVYLECADKAATEPFIKISTADFSSWNKVV